MEIISRPLPYVSELASRDPQTVELLVVHCTELPDLRAAREYGEVRHYVETGTGNSGHFYIDRDGRCEQWVPIEKVAHHVRGFNPQSIGVELVNRGRWPDWFHGAHQVPDETYPPAQVLGLLNLIAELRRTLPRLSKIAGHAELDREQIPSVDDPTVLIQRKIDPGPQFPWDQIVPACGLRRVPD